MAEVTCPLCNGPTEEHEQYRDRACPKCGLSAPPDVLERIRALATSGRLTDELRAQRAMSTGCANCDERLKDSNAWLVKLEAAERELARLKQPAHVLAEAERLLRAVLVNRVTLSSTQGASVVDYMGARSHAVSLAEAYGVHAAFDAARVAGATPRLCPGCRSLDGEHDFGPTCTVEGGGAYVG